MDYMLTTILNKRKETEKGMNTVTIYGTKVNIMTNGSTLKIHQGNKELKIIKYNNKEGRPSTMEL